MKKILNQSSFDICITYLAGGWFIQYEIHKREILQFVAWKPRPNIVDPNLLQVETQ